MKKHFVLLAGLLFAASSAGASFPVAQHGLPAGSASAFHVGAGMGTDGSVFDNREAQTFVPTTSGFLASIYFDVYRSSTTNADLKISITSVVAGQPAVTLESIYLPASAVSTTALSSAFLMSGAFSQSVSASGTLLLNAGTTYALVFSSDTVEANYRLYGDGSGYAQGTRMQFQNSGPYQVTSDDDLIFRVMANSVPEPAAGLLLGLSGLLLAGSRRRIPRSSGPRSAEEMVDSTDDYES